MRGLWLGVVRIAFWFCSEFSKLLIVSGKEIFTVTARVCGLLEEDFCPSRRVSTPRLTAGTTEGIAMFTHAKKAAQTKPAKSEVRPPVAQSHAPSSIHHLQRAIGNGAVQRRLMQQSGASSDLAISRLPLGTPASGKVSDFRPLTAAEKAHAFEIFYDSVD
jgi:hypothetical protein